MANKTVQINSFCGGTSKLVDSAFLGFEESVNMYPETVRATDSFTSKMLKSLEGFKEFTDPSSFVEDYSRLETKNRTFYLASKSPADSINAGAPVIYTLINHRVWRIYKDGTVKHVGRIARQNTATFAIGETSFAETSGDPSYLAICCKVSDTPTGGNVTGAIFLVDLEAEDDNTATLSGRVSSIELPDAFDHEGKVVPTCVSYLNYRLVINDEGHDYIYWSELNKPNGVDNAHAFAQLLTRYAYTKTNGEVVTFDDNVYYPPSYGTYQEGTLQTEEEWMSALNNVKVDFRADNIRSIVSTDTSIFVFGSTSYQIYKWQQSEYAPFTTTGKTAQVGTNSGDTVAVLDNMVYFLGYGTVGSNAVWSASEGGLERISTNAVEQRIAGVKEQDKAYGFAYSYKGHAFYVITFYGKEDDFTLCYDITEGEWHTRASLDQFGNLGAWDARFAVAAYGKVLFSVLNKVNIYVMDQDSFVDSEGRPIVRSRTTGIKFDNFNDVIVRSLELITDNGAGKNPEVDPRVVLQVSTDGGFTWSNEKWIKSGKVGQRNFRTMWRDLGNGNKIAFKVKVTDPAPFNIATAMLEYAPLKNRIG